MKFLKTKLDNVKPYYQNYYLSLNGGFDDFYEDLIKESNHYLIEFSNEIIGCFAVNNDNQLVCLYVFNEYKHIYEEIFERIISFDYVSSIKTITNDTMMMNEIIRRNFNFTKGAYNFKYIGDSLRSSLKMRKAKLEDIEDIKVLFKDFFDNYEERIKKGCLYLGYVKDKIVSLGNTHNHTFNHNVISIGVIVVESERYKGYGVDTIKSLTKEGLDKGLIVQAGCWLYNHASKKMLIKAGLTKVNMIITVNEF